MGCCGLQMQMKIKLMETKLWECTEAFKPEKYATIRNSMKIYNFELLAIFVDRFGGKHFGLCD